MKKYILPLIGLGLLTFNSCKNADIDHPDYIYQTLSFAQQSPIRTIVLGDDGDFSTEMDNNHQFRVMATLGGVNENKSRRTVEIKLAPELLEGVTFADGRPTMLLPDDYYEISSTKIEIPKGMVRGGTVVTLTDKFFEDPLSTGVNYVLPMIMYNGSDSILEGRPSPGVENPNRYVSYHWSVTPKDYQLLALKYKNPYHGVWLSQGIDKINNNGATSEVNRNKHYWEEADTCQFTTVKINIARRHFAATVTVKDANGKDVDRTISCDVDLTVSENGAITVSTQTPECTASGNGQWTYKGAVKAWGNKDRDYITLNYSYSIPYVVDESTGQTAVYSVQREEKLVMRDRQSRFETFEFTYNQ